MTFSVDFHCPKKMNPNSFGDKPGPLNLHQKYKKIIALIHAPHWVSFHSEYLKMDKSSWPFLWQYFQNLSGGTSSVENNLASMVTMWQQALLWLYL